MSKNCTHCNLLLIGTVGIAVFLMVATAKSCYKLGISDTQALYGFPPPAYDVEAGELPEQQDCRFRILYDKKNQEAGVMDMLRLIALVPAGSGTFPTGMVLNTIPNEPTISFPILEVECERKEFTRYCMREDGCPDWHSNRMSYNYGFDYEMNMLTEEIPCD